MNDALKRNAERTPVPKAETGLPARRRAYVRPQLAQTDLRQALSDSGLFDDGGGPYSKYLS